ncbi:MAG: hypothetical protein IIA40_07695 [SAR324 cluster bacterium]|nr:hypothetical protein [SAR324 cluster bacterium]
MLAYIFWHRPYPDVEREAYEAALTGFHARLAEASCPGLQGSAAYRIAPAPWLGQQPGYEDWNLVDASWALDPLNRVAVSGSMETVHAAVASLMDFGCGGLYSHLFGDIGRIPHSRVVWLTRPRGIRYQEPLEDLATTVQGPLCCWRRQMVLGPAPEFALVGDAGFEPALPTGWSAISVERVLLETGGAG